MIKVELNQQEKQPREIFEKDILRGTAFWGKLVGYESHGRVLLIKTSEGYFDIAGNTKVSCSPFVSSKFWTSGGAFTDYEEVDLTITVTRKS